MLRALSCLHHSKIVHADIKLDNWVIRRNGEGYPQICLIDFGKSKDIAFLRDPNNLHGKVLSHMCNSIPDTSKFLSSFDFEGLTFVGLSTVKGFQCPQMLERKSWTFQVSDYYKYTIYVAHISLIVR